MKLSALLAPLIAAKVPHEQILSVILAFEGEQENALDRRRKADAERQSRHRSRDVTLRNSDKLLVRGGDARALDNLLTKVIEPQESKKEKKEAQATPRDELETVLDPTRAGAVLEHRQRLRKPLTAHAARLLAGKLSKCPDPNAAADTMIGNGWQGFEPEWLTPSPRGSPKGPTLSERFAQLGQFANERQNGNGLEAPQQALRLVPPSPADE